MIILSPLANTTGTTECLVTSRMINCDWQQQQQHRQQQKQLILCTVVASIDEKHDDRTTTDNLRDFIDIIEIEELERASIISST